MDLMDYGTMALGMLMIWLLYKVTRETRQFIASDKRRVFREIRASGTSRPRTARVSTRRS
jgi:hypothetical protein